MKTIKMKSKFIPTKEERAQYEALPDNMPETKLTAKQKELVSDLYYKYLSPIDNYSWGWGRSLQDIEKSERWPSGPRVTDVQAQRICLNMLFGAREKMGQKEAMEYFFRSMNNRDSWRRICQNIYEI